MITEVLRSIIFGILEGITEWLPVSSTGHLILLGDLLGGNVASELGEEFASAYSSMFDFVIQLGAIAAVAALFFGKLNVFSRKKNAAEKRNTLRLYGILILASLPAALAVILGDALCERFFGTDIDGVFYNSFTVGCMLIIYGVIFVFAERGSQGRALAETGGREDITLGDALFIGCFQALSVIPGTSRSGATILGARLRGIRRDAAAEFSFLLAIPAISGASLLGVLDFARLVNETGVSVPPHLYLSMAVAAITAFLVSLLTVKLLLAFVKKHTFLPFAVYRIALGVCVLLW